MSKHTPGPWAISRKSASSNRAWISAAGWGKFARVVVRMNGSSVDCQDGLANVRLIAAAPDLLAALKAMRDECMGTAPQCADQVDAAICKAEGQQ
jgi:hypothetical protein